jgi:hypothetical protein
MKIHELLPPEAIRLDFAPSPGQELNALISLACSRVSGATSEACQFQEDELHLIHEYMSGPLCLISCASIRFVTVVFHVKLRSELTYVLFNVKK